MCQINTESVRPKRINNGGYGLLVLYLHHLSGIPSQCQVSLQWLIPVLKPDHIAHCHKKWILKTLNKENCITRIISAKDYHVRTFIKLLHLNASFYHHVSWCCVHWFLNACSTLTKELLLLTVTFLGMCTPLAFQCNQCTTKA